MHLVVLHFDPSIDKLKRNSDSHHGTQHREVCDKGAMLSTDLLMMTIGAKYGSRDPIPNPRVTPAANNAF
jgi:hypothetical protein